MLLVCSLCVSASDLQTIKYEESVMEIANPLKGWVIWGETPVTPPQPTTLFFSYRSWRQLEPEEGTFDFQSWEEDVWSHWTDQGMKAIFRVYLDYPGRSIGVPQWLIDAGLEMTEYDDHGGGWSPDYENPLLLEKLQRFIAALAERYDNDPRVAFIDVGLLGHWGEWHTYPRTELFASASVQRAVMETFIERFQSKKLMLRYPTLWTAQRPFGYRDDCFLTDTDGPESWYFLNRIRSSHAQDVWKTQPIGGEFCGGGNGAIQGTLEQPDECLRLIREGHFSHLGPAGGSMVSQTPEHQQTITQMLKTMGYRFVLKEATFAKEIEDSTPITVEVTVENKGSAPFYYSWPLNYQLLSENKTILSEGVVDVDIREWLPGSHHFSFTISDPPALSPGDSIQIALRIPDKDNHGPSVRFENEGEEINGAFVLGEIVYANASSSIDWDKF